MVDFTRLKFSEEVSVKLSELKGRTGLTPNILCRIGFCMSLEQPGIPKPEEFPADSDREIDRQVLLGKWDSLFVAMLQERSVQDGLQDPRTDDIVPQLRAHMHRGVYLLHKRVKSFQDLIHLLPSAQRRLESDK